MDGWAWARGGAGAGAGLGTGAGAGAETGAGMGPAASADAVDTNADAHAVAVAADAADALSSCSHECAVGRRDLGRGAARTMDDRVALSEWVWKRGWLYAPGLCVWLAALREKP